MKVAVVIPAKDEEKTIGYVVEGAKKHADLVIVVDDGSSDRTAERAAEAGAKVLKLSKNMGKGYAMRVGAKKAIEMGAECIVFMDADGQHRAEDLPKFVKGLEEADVVFGQRSSGRMPVIKRVGNWGIAFLFRLLFGSWPGDMLCGFKAFRREALEKVWWKSNDYFVETEVTAKALLKKLRVKKIEIPVIYRERQKGTTVWDGIKIGLKMLLLRLWLLGEKS